MNENERTPAETAADYAVHFADGFFVPCPCCGKEVKSPDNGFTSEKEAMEWALGACDCAGAKAWQQQRPALRMDSPCVAGKMKAGRISGMPAAARCTGSACSAYHPELYAPDLYARAFDLYAKRKADEKEWAEFHPAATIMRYCRQLAAPAPYWEPPTYTKQEAAASAASFAFYPSRHRRRKKRTSTQPTSANAKPAKPAAASGKNGKSLRGCSLNLSRTPCACWEPLPTWSAMTT